MERNFLNPADVGGRIRQARKAIGLSQERFAERVGATRRTVVRWENGKGPLPNQNNMHAISLVTGRDADYFLLGDDEDDEESSLPLSREHAELLSALAHALEPFRKRGAEA